MADIPLFVLSEDVEFIPINAIDHKIKSHFQYDENDVVVTHFNTRKSSKVIDTRSADLLKEFKSPKSWAEVIFQFAQTNQKDPQDVADEAYQLLVDMHRDGFLVPYKLATGSSATSLLQINEHFNCIVITEKKRILDDTEVYFGRDDFGKNLVIKFIKHLAEDEVPNEVSVLNLLDGRVNLPVLMQGRHEDSYYFVTEWFESFLCREELDKYRNFLVRENLAQALQVCINILEAYSCLHGQGVVHGDVNDENILVSPSGAVKLIDFNMASWGDYTPAVREGVCYYYEPELASTRLKNLEDIPPTIKGEQYAIASVLYSILSGSHYLDFSLEKEKLYQQVQDERPIPFSACDLNLPAELDTAFAKALAKDPNDRFPSLDEFASALVKIRGEVISDNRYFTAGKNHSEKRFVQFAIETYGWNSIFFEKGLNQAPTCSVNFGAAGIAYMFYRMACVREDDSLLDLADVWASRASSYVTNRNKAFYAAEIEITQVTVGSNSIYHGAAGIHLVQSLINSCRGDYSSVFRSMDQYLAVAKEPCDNLDLALGKAGLLTGFAILYLDLMGMQNINLDPIIQAGNGMMKVLWDILDQYPSLAGKNKVDYFGIAHGWAGILYATLYWCSASGQKLPANFTHRIDQLEDCRIENKETIFWPVTIADRRPWTGWCNGSAGHVFLWSLMHKYFKNEKYLTMAEKAARHVLQDRSGRIYNLCCGSSGQAYALLSLYNLTGEKKYLEESSKLKQKILDNISYPSERINSLYKSLPGAAVLACELERPDLARMPLFQ